MSTFVPNMSAGPCLYCNGSSAEAPEELLRCELCRRSTHISCLRSSQPEGRLLGDNFFEYTCSQCHQSTQDSCIRAKLSTLQILLLVLYNLHKSDAYTARSGFYHWKLHIYNFINQHWKEIFGPESRKKKKKVVQASLSGQLSHYGQYFVSGYETLRDGGWYRLAVVLPPAQLIQQQMEEKRGGRPGGNGDSVRGRGRKFLKEDSSRVRTSGITATSEMVWVKEEPLERESVSSGDVSFDSLSHDDSSRGSWFTERDLLKPNNRPPQALFDSDEDDDMTLQTEIKEEITIKQEQLDSEMIDVGESEAHHVPNIKTEVQEEPLPCLKPSLFTKSTPPPPPLKKIEEPHKEGRERLRPLSSYEERQLLRKLEHLQEAGPLPPHLLRLRRKLVVRKSKYEHGLPVFDLDAEIKYINSHGRLRTRREKIYSKLSSDPGDSAARVLDRFQVAIGDEHQKQTKNSSFLVKLVGDPEGSFSYIHSPYTLQKLKPFIRRDYESVPLKLKLLQEIIQYPHRHNSAWQPPMRHPIDYCYVTPKHIPAMNQLARHFFWPGIDLSEVLQYPDHTCVVLYRNLVVGFGVLVPDIGFNMAYLSFLLVHPEWRRAGIATFVLYHLIQTCMGKDITLHVSATNPALILYQQFGFKVEEFLSDFYDKYYPEDSPECKHAMYLRLSR
ncbi:cysteine-rich protein 2-binding protein-like isoform X1 [Penaeus monodon]|uniref:cysteine-rich protein 2-binding protein-like isoform X1 n=1 Tax=Penaeus monodon TaxID=6687 RepID=UPI0018A71939|nr:cysteine-rich protein 2-binding protein-like isoform X1 [Penaeus monodon]XP_037788267.1 cysteine-rich protein 2-binding protein-like isoform X1 [Penaeus monodon]